MYVPTVDGNMRGMTVDEWEEAMSSDCAICENWISPDDFSAALLDDGSNSLVCGACCYELSIIDLEGMVC